MLLRHALYAVLQCKELAETINAVPADVVIIATPMDLKKLIKIDKPTCTVRCADCDQCQAVVLDQLPGYSNTGQMGHQCNGAHGKQGWGFGSSTWPSCTSWLANAYGAC